MIHYHGGPFSDPLTAVVVWRGRHAMISFARPEQIKTAAEVCQSFCLDNGAFTLWKRKTKRDFAAYYAWVDRWIRHPGCDFAIVPDCIQGTEEENDELLASWPFERWHGCPVWHLHESLRRLRRLTKVWPRVAFGSSGAFSTPGTPEWWNRMQCAMRVCCDPSGVPRTRLHGLRMLNPELFCKLPWRPRIRRTFREMFSWTESGLVPTRRVQNGSEASCSSIGSNRTTPQRTGRQKPPKISYRVFLRPVT